LVFWAWLTLLRVMFSSSIHVPANDKISYSVFMLFHSGLADGVQLSCCLFVLFFFYCRAGWKHIVAFTKVLTVNQLCHASPTHTTVLCPPSPISGVASTGIILHLHAYVHIFAPYSPFYSLSPSLLPSHWFHNWFISSNFLHSSSVPFLWYFQLV
jgi:hypothetical protein